MRCRAAATVLLALAGCATTQTEDLENFQRSVEGYNEAYRWKNYQRASAFLPAELRTPFVAGYEEDDKSLHIEGYQILEVRPVSDQAAEVKVRYRFMLLPSVTLESRTVTQHWAKDGQRWLLEHEDDSIRPLDRSLIGEPEPEAAPFGGGATVEVEVLGPDGEVVGRRRDGPPPSDTAPE